MEKDKKKKAGHSGFKLGEMLIKYRIITREQMEHALKLQEKRGGRLGRNLIQLNYITENVFIKFLSGQLGIKSVNLNEMEIGPNEQKLLPLDMIKKCGVLPIKKEGSNLYLGMTDPTNINTIGEIEFTLGCRVVPLVMAESQWEYALGFFREKGWGSQTLTKKAAVKTEIESGYDLKALMKELITNKGSDIHLSVGVPPTFRINDQLVRLKLPPLTPARITEILSAVLTKFQMEHLKKNLELDFAMAVDGLGRFRFNIYRQRNEFAAAVRHIIEHIPTLEELALPGWLPGIVSRSQGLILITGPSGHGKSTTMACLIDIINTTRSVNIITIEDPVEYVHRHKSSNVNQREIGTDTSSFRDGIKYIFRQDPDVIAIGEMRDLESIAIALTAAETGHLVLATLHTQSALGTIDRIIDVFPAGQQNQVRSQLANSLIMIFSQRLINRADGAGRILAYEKLSNSYRVQNSIRESRAHMLKSQATLAAEDYIPMEFSLAELVRRGAVKYNEALKFAEDQKLFEKLAKKT